MKAVWSRLAKKISVAIYLAKSDKDVYLGRLMFDPDDWQAFMLIHSEWTYIAK